MANNITPFDDIIYAVGNSQEHLDINNRIFNFIFEKIYGTTMPTGCAGLCTTTPTFTGLSNDCSNSEKIITMSNTPTGVSIQWVLPSGLQLISGQATNSIKLTTTAAGSFNGYVQLSWPDCTSVNYPFTVVFTQPGLSITGPSQLCTTATYKIPNLPAGVAVSWTASPSGSVGLSSSADSVNLSLYDSSILTLTATISTSCGNVLISKQITAGTPPFPPEMVVQGPVNVIQNGEGYYEIPAHPAIVSYEWEVNGGSATIFQDGSRFVKVYFHSAEFYEILPKVTTACGQVMYLDDRNLYVSVYPSGYFSYKFSPNPASNELNIYYEKSTNYSSSYNLIEKIDKRTFEAKLIDNQNNILRVAKSKIDDRIVFNTSDIPNGTYFLHVKEGKEIIKQQIIIQH